MTAACLFRFERGTGGRVWYGSRMSTVYRFRRGLLQPARAATDGEALFREKGDGECTQKILSLDMGSFPVTDM